MNILLRFLATITSMWFAGAQHKFKQSVHKCVWQLISSFKRKLRPPLFDARTILCLLCVWRQLYKTISYTVNIVNCGSYHFPWWKKRGHAIWTGKEKGKTCFRIGIVIVGLFSLFFVKVVEYWEDKPTSEFESCCGARRLLSLWWMQCQQHDICEQCNRYPSPWVIDGSCSWLF